MIFEFALEVVSPDLGSAAIYSPDSVTRKIMRVMLRNLEQKKLKIAPSGFHHYDVIVTR